MGTPTRAHWRPDAYADECMDDGCVTAFSFFERRHHCRMCGNIYCSVHCASSLNLDVHALPSPAGSSHKVCETCYNRAVANSVSYRRREIDAVTQSGPGGGGGAGGPGFFSLPAHSAMLPDMLSLGGGQGGDEGPEEECFLSHLVDHINDTFGYLNFAVEQLAGMTDFGAKFDFLERERGPLASYSASLVEEEQTLQRCLTHPLIAEDPNAFNYVATLTGEVTRAGSWAANLETSLLEDITSETVRDRPDLAARVASFEAAADHLMTDMYALADTSEKSSISNMVLVSDKEFILQQLNILGCEIDNEREAMADVVGAETYIARLDSVMQTLTFFLSTTSGAVGVDMLEVRTAEFEDEMYALVTATDELDGEDEAVERVRSEIADFKSNVRESKDRATTLSEELEDQRDRLERVINRLGDLQEHVADLEHRFVTRFGDGEAGVLDLPGNMISETNLADARARHEEIENDLFGL